jgi:D-glycero-D-manno-heptose 1,7-bisphosphate phosphatase
MLIGAAEKLGVDLARSWMVGDTDGDVLAGRAAGCRTLLITHGSSRHKRSGTAGADALAPNLEAAAALLVREEPVN